MKMKIIFNKGILCPLEVSVNAALSQMHVT